MKEYILRLTEAEYESLRNEVQHFSIDLNLDSVRIKLNRALPELPPLIYLDFKNISKEKLEAVRKQWQEMISNSGIYINYMNKHIEPIVEFDFKKHLSERNPILR